MARSASAKGRGAVAISSTADMPKHEEPSMSEIRHIVFDIGNVLLRCQDISVVP